MNIFEYKIKKMKKIILSALSVLILGSIIFISCKSKNDSKAITPTYKEDAGTGGNPSITNVTTTGTVATTSTAYQNSSMTNVGSGGTWSSVGCSGQSCITVNNSSTNTSITICFSAPPAAGTYQLVNSQSALAGTTGKAFMTVTNPTGQPTGSVWYSVAGSVVVGPITGTGITATFNNIACLQASSAFPTVTISGQVGCL